MVQQELIQLVTARSKDEMRGIGLWVLGGLGFQGFGVLVCLVAQDTHLTEGLKWVSNIAS